jgi:excisionase family DNA binding protein
MPVTKLYRVEEAADLLGLQPSTIRKLISLRRITVCRPTTRAVRISEAELARIQKEGTSPRREDVRP